MFCDTKVPQALASWVALGMSGLLIVLLMGCSSASTTRPSTSRQGPPEVRTVDYKPSWLLTKDEAGSVRGDRIRVPSGQSLTGIGAFDYRSTSGDDLVITFMSGGRVVYWEGTGSITKRSTGERVLLPPLSTTSSPSSAASVSQLRELTIQTRETQTERVHVRRILGKSKSQASSIRQNLLNGTRFAQMARLHSICPSDQRGGDLGAFPKGRCETF